jgi:hypothetical protein
MQSIIGDAAVFRTQLLTKAKAERFRRCVSANRQYTGAALLESNRAKDPVRRWFVQYRPASQERQAILLANRQRERLDRALQEGPEYVWVEDPDAQPGREFFHCQSVSGEVYEVDARARGCTCGDYLQRCQKLGLRCKHLLAWDLGLGTLIRKENLPVYARRRAA